MALVGLRVGTEGAGRPGVWGPEAGGLTLSMFLHSSIKLCRSEKSKF